jgi:hypothetical protein
MPDVEHTPPVGEQDGPRRVAAAVLWRLGDASSCRTASILYVTGGT